MWLAKGRTFVLWRVHSVYLNILHIFLRLFIALLRGYAVINKERQVFVFPCCASPVVYGSSFQPYLLAITNFSKAATATP